MNLKAAPVFLKGLGFRGSGFRVDRVEGSGLRVGGVHGKFDGCLSVVRFWLIVI